MRVLLVSTRGGPQGRAWWERAAEQAALLQSPQCQVTWLQIFPPEQVIPDQHPDLEIRRVNSSQPGFTAIEAGLADVPGEFALIRELRHDPPDVVHLFGYGNCGSASMPWVCARLGVPSVVNLDLRETLCHRGTLIDATGSPCLRWDDPEHCLACCLSPVGEGLTPAQAWRARRLRFLGALSPYPSLAAFQNRADITIGGLAFAQRIIVADGDAARALQDLGVVEKLIQIQAELGDQAWIELYSAVSPL